ncbi:MAG: DNA alkylation repair protein [Chloroflexi bacterium]|nr:DNA alkylation repair protein [Chloroflexota bacterium]
MEHQQILQELQALGNPAALEGMARYGINPRDAYGIAVPRLREIARRVGRNHQLAQELWASGFHVARIRACMVDAPRLGAEAQMEAWVADFDSWDVCDQCCGNLFDKTALACAKAIEWSGRNEEFVKRAGFALMAYLAFHNKRMPDDDFVAFMPIIKHEAVDSRNYVKKAVNWALRQIGKRNSSLNGIAIATATEIRGMDSKAARWIAADALRELVGKQVRSK